MTTYYSADYVLPANGQPIHNGVVEVIGDGIIGSVHVPGSPKLVGKTISRHRGIITPGFVNAHCHLELSHLVGLIPKRTGLAPFLQHVMALRTADGDRIQQAMRLADKQLHDHGVVAVGDHANTAVSAPVKAASRIRYHTFVETLGFEPELAKQRFAAAEAIAQGFDGHNASLTAHAPYSVSKELFKLLSDEAVRQQHALSIHNQESEAENKLFRYKTGQFLAFYEALGKDISAFKAQARDSLQTFLAYLSPEIPVLLVHNTYTAPKDIFYVERQERNVTWCFCPNANLYIEGTLPKVNSFVHYGHRITLGTDSLASNDRLCILSELKTIHQHFPELPLTETIKWATINGARFLGIDETHGSLEPGKTPGVNLLKGTNGLAITPDTEVVRLA